MSTAQELAILISGKDASGSAALRQTRNELQQLDSTAKSTTKGLGDLTKQGALMGAGFLGVASVADAVRALGASYMGTIDGAKKLEQQMSFVKAVSNATAGETKALTAQAMQLGPAWGQSAVAVGKAMEELVKGGVSVKEISNGAAQAVMTLAQAGGVDLATGANVAANAMNVFGLSGKDMAHVADMLAGAANATTANIEDFALALQMASAVSAQMNQSFDATTVALSLMAQAGIKNSDAGTSLKQMMLSLEPTSVKAAATMKELGLITADGANRFFDATGKTKSYRDISEVLQESLRGLSDQQRIAALQVIFGSDAIRAATVMAKAGAEGYDRMYSAMSNTSALDVAKTRIDNLAGSEAKLNAEMETLSTHMGQSVAPAMKRGADETAGLVHQINQSNAKADAAITRFKELRTQGVGMTEAMTQAKAETSGLAGSLASVNSMLPDTAAGAISVAAAMRDVAVAAGSAGKAVHTGFGVGLLPDQLEKQLQVPAMEAVAKRRVELAQEAANEAAAAMKRASDEAVREAERAADAIKRAEENALDGAKELAWQFADSGKETADKITEIAATADEKIADLGRATARSIQDAKDAASQALADLSNQEILRSSIEARRKSLEGSISDAEAKHKVEVENAEALYDLNTDLARAKDDKERETIRQRFAWAQEDLAHRRKLEAAEAAWREANVERPRAELEKALRDEELNRQRARIEAEAKAKTDALQAEMKAREEELKAQAAKDITRAEETAKAAFEKLRDNFLRKLPAEAGGVVAEIMGILAGASGAAEAAIGLASLAARSAVSGSSAGGGGASGGSSGGGAPAAGDGQSLYTQSPDVQKLFKDTYGSDAASQWAAEHNKEIGKAALGFHGIVGGPGGTDSQLFASWVSPGERIDITPAGQTGGGGVVVNVNNPVFLTGDRSAARQFAADLKPYLDDVVELTR